MLPPVPPDPNGAATAAAAPVAPGGAGLPPTSSVPAASPAAPAVVPPPVITDASNIKTRPDAQDIKNPFERTATLLVDGAQSAAQRLSASLSEQPADSTEPDPATVHEMMNFSPYGNDAPTVFWQVHDQLLAQAAANNDPDPYAVAERGALDQAYPYRSKLALLDVLSPEEKVKRAEELQNISNRQTAKGHTPESMPFNVAPNALPADQAVMPGTNGTSSTSGGPQ